MGDVERVKYLVRSEAVDVNKRDRWDSVPLYYACLAGLLSGLHLTCRHYRSAFQPALIDAAGTVRQIARSSCFALQVTLMLRRCFWSMAQFAMSGHLTVSFFAWMPTAPDCLDCPEGLI